MRQIGIRQTLTRSKCQLISLCDLTFKTELMYCYRADICQILPIIKSKRFAYLHTQFLFSNFVHKCFLNNLKSAFFTVSTKIFIEGTHKNSHICMSCNKHFTSLKSKLLWGFSCVKLPLDFFTALDFNKKGLFAHSLCKNILRKNAAQT